MIGASGDAGGTARADELADHLLTEFGSLGAVLAASPRRLERVLRGAGSTTHGISRFNAAATHVLRSRITDRPLFSCLPDVVDYLRFDMSFIVHERVRVLHLDARNHLIRDEQVGEGTATRAVVEVRSIIERAIDLGSASLILVHNHPSGDPTPSRQDIDLTIRIADEARRHGIAVMDHLIIGAEKAYSMHLAGILA